MHLQEVGKSQKTNSNIKLQTTNKVVKQYVWRVGTGEGISKVVHEQLQMAVCGSFPMRVTFYGNVHLREMKQWSCGGVLEASWWCSVGGMVMVVDR